MSSPAKRRKLNGSSQSSPSSSRNLDYFFRKQTQKLPARPSNNGEQDIEDSRDKSELTDEQLARKLQAEWDQEAAGARQPSVADGILSSSGPPDINTGFQPSEQTDLNGESSDTYKSAGLDLKPQVPHEGPTSTSKGTLSLQSAGSTEDTITSNVPFDESPLTFEPSKYIVDLQGHWAADGGNASYALLTRCFVLVNSTQSRIKIVDTLVNLLRVIIEGDPSSLLPTVRTIYCLLPYILNIYFSIYYIEADVLDLKLLFSFASSTEIINQVVRYG
jgi:DNA ligase 1